MRPPVALIARPVDPDAGLLNDYADRRFLSTSMLESITKDCAVQRITAAAAGQRDAPLGPRARCAASTSELASVCASAARIDARLA